MPQFSLGALKLYQILCFINARTIRYLSPIFVQSPEKLENTQARRDRLYYCFLLLYHKLLKWLGFCNSIETIMLTKKFHFIVIYTFYYLIIFAAFSAFRFIYNDMFELP